jgi:hypothetical protein
MGVKLDNGLWYNHVPKSVAASLEGKVTILWNQQVRTEQIILPSNKPDAINRKNKQGTCMLIDDAIPGEIDMIKKKMRKF